MDDLPIKDDAIPVGANSKHLGEVGSSPALLRRYSINRANNLIR